MIDRVGDVSAAAPRATAGAAADSPATARRKEALHKACVEFEAVFLQEIVKGMRRSIPREEGEDGGKTERDMTDGLFDEHFARALAKSESGGLADVLYRSLVGRIPQEGADPK